MFVEVFPEEVFLFADLRNDLQSDESPNFCEMFIFNWGSFLIWIRIAS